MPGTAIDRKLYEFAASILPGHHQIFIRLKHSVRFDSNSLHATKRPLKDSFRFDS
jgi:hypothetical protein